MERSPRSAGVHPRTGTNMGQYHTFRSFVISLAIAIAITKSPASGFTIRQSQNILNSTPDLETGESTQQEVRYDLNALNDNKANSSKTKEESDSTVLAINDPKNIDKHNFNNEKVNLTPLIINKPADIQNQIIEETKYKISPGIPKLTSPETIRFFYTTSAPSTSQTTTREPEENPYLSTNFTSQKSLAIESQIFTVKKFSNVTIENDNVPQDIKGNETNTVKMQRKSESNKEPDNQNFKGEIDSTEQPDTTYTTNNDVNKSDNKTNDSATEDGEVTTTEVTHLMLETHSYIQNQTPVTEMIPEQTNTKEKTLLTQTDGSLEATTTTASEPDGSLEATTTTASEPETAVTNVTFEASTTELPTTEMFYTESSTTSYYSTTLPLWKKYTTIDRKRANTEGITTLGKDMARAETAQTLISLDKVFENTPIPSLEQLKNDLIIAQESTTRKLETTNRIEANVSSAPDIEITTSTAMMAAGIGTESTKLEIVSKRAGYKDNRQTTTPKPEEATTSVFLSKVNANNTEMFSSMYETEPSEVEVSDSKNHTVYESHIQLAEDAIKEELLKEETLNDNEEILQRHHDELIPTMKHVKQAKVADDTSTVQEIVTEDILSVKPISQDKKKQSILYAVSPNYKPLKKIDIQPPKQFIRDPDDNSWRNESISSLGIVFKPKNASKSFTQVLKNKTEVELGNMTDKDNKGDVPDLRVRLEKIAEVRKSKKKNVNKFGDTVYGDYEESSEIVKFTKTEDTTSPMSPSVESMLSFSSPLLPKSSMTQMDLTVNAIPKERLDFFKHEGTTPLTTNKPKKLFNLAEYYDATDEYDTDYVNQHKIDLKKFTQPLKSKETFTTQPPHQQSTKAMREYTPERKATVQYFPPTQKVTQKVNMNDYDSDFNRKVNLYTYKVPPKNGPSASYGTVSPIRTEKYEQIHKFTTKPPYAMYKPENLDKNLYLTNQLRVTELPNAFVSNDGNFNRASYVIKHYRDFINEAVKDGESDGGGEFPYTESPLRGVTINDLAKMNVPKDSNQGEEDTYDYDVKFRKDVMNKFVDNFNQNSERFKVDFPILYNSSVVHTQTAESGKVASSSAFLKRLYEVGNSRPSNLLSPKKACDPNCDNLTVELSPAYELHYYVPDQEEKEEIEPRPMTVPYRYRL